MLYRAARLKPDAIPRIFVGLPNYLSTPKPEARGSPEKRARRVEKMHQDKQVEWLKSDNINSFQDLRAALANKLSTDYPEIQIQQHNNHVVLFKFKNNDDINSNPVISFCMRIFDDLLVRLWINSVELQKAQFQWLLSHTEGRLCLWSQLWELLNRYSKDVSEVDITSKSGHVASLVEELGELNNSTETYNFIAEQLKLLCLNPHRYRYTSETLIIAFQIYHKSPACYLQMKQLFCLPSVRLLQQVSSNLNVSGSTDYVTFLKNKAALLKPKERLVNVQLDEIYIKSKLQYKGEKLIGQADNSDREAATRIQCFMLSSIRSKNKDVISLIPVQKMNAEQLCQVIKQVIANVTEAGYQIVSIISDNNVINRKSFILLSGSETLKPFIINPLNNEKIFLLFDTVHLLKCICNNWLNLKGDQKTFDFPDIANKDIIWAASFSHFEVLHELEQTSLIKQAHRLNYKSIHPHCIERQNVKLVLRLFCDSTIAALKTLGPTNPRLPNWKGTVQFVTLILKFWNIVNVKSLFKGQHKRLDDANPVRDLNDSRISWMVSFVSWLENWKTYSNINNTACLTNETHTALRHTVNTMVYMLYELLSSHTLDYVILGKFQTDNLESRFGQYRQLSGCNYLVSVA